MIHSFYIFGPQGACLYYKSWNRPRFVLIDSPGEDQRLMFGLIFSLKTLAKGLSPDPDREGGVRRYRTKSYTLFHMETPTALHFVLTTDNSVRADMQSHLRAIYSTIFRRYVLLNPLYKMGEPIENAAFESATDEYLKALPEFS